MKCRTILNFCFKSIATILKMVYQDFLRNNWKEKSLRIDLSIQETFLKYKVSWKKNIKKFEKFFIKNDKFHKSEIFHKNQLFTK